MKKVIGLAVILCVAGTSFGYSFNTQTTWTGGNGDFGTSGNWSANKPGGGWPARDGHIDTAGIITGFGDLTGNSTPHELTISHPNADLQASGHLYTKMAHINQSAGSITVASTYGFSAEGGNYGGGFPNNYMDGVKHLMTGGVLSANNLTTNNNNDTRGELSVTGTAQATVWDTLTIGNNGNVDGLVTVGAGGQLDVDLEEDGGGIHVNGDGTLSVEYGGVVTAGSLTVDAGGIVIVYSNTLIIKGDERAAMNTLVSQYRLFGTVDANLDGNGDTVITPEPATMCLLAIGGIGALVRRRRR